MILPALHNYYEILKDDPEVDIAQEGYSNAPVSYALNLSETGELLDIIPLSAPIQKGKKTVEGPRRMNVPEQVKRSVNIAANFLCDNATYVLGLTDREAKDPDYAKKRFEAFKQLNISILSGANSPAAQAVIAFLQNYDLQTAAQHPVIAPRMEELQAAVANLIFQVQGKDVLNDPEVQRVWGEYRTGQGSSKGGKGAKGQVVTMQCLVTGGIESVARLHPDIKGVPGAQAKGASLVSFNLPAFTSYGKEQGANSPVSQRVASGYGVALNYLLSRENPNRPIFLGDTTVIYWADTPNKRYASTFYAFLNPEVQQEQKANETAEEAKGKRRRAKEAEKTLSEVAEAVGQGKAIDLAGLREGLDANTRLYVLGLAPNASRLSVRFFLTEPFGVFAERIMAHYDDMQIEKEYPNQPTYISPYRILSECVSPKVTQRDEEVRRSWSLLGGAFLRAILMGTPYPEALYAAMINRIRHDTDETNDEGRSRNIKINYVRAAYIKAHLMRKYRRQGNNTYKEALQMSLNESYTNPAYVLGRLFAVLEKAQQEAIGQNINATIKDRYFTSACAAPATVFPTLLRLAHHWTSKAEYGGISDRKIQELLNMLDAKPFPNRLILDEQGVFVLGYYHQRASFYNKKERGEAN